MGRRIIPVVAAVICAMTSCMKEQAPQEETAVQNRTVAVTFTPRAEASTRSSINPDEGVMNDITVIAYRNGQLHSYVRGASPTMKVSSGCTYNLYALANGGTITPTASEETFRRNCQLSIRSISDLSSGIPMVWERKGWTPAAHSPSQSVDVSLQRMASKISLSLDRGTLKGLKITSVRLMNSPLSVRPFTAGGSRVMDPSGAGNGDYASAADLDRLNAGSAISFYTLENCQGTLLPGNTDPWKKVPSGISGKESLCTWIEVKGTFAPGNFYSGDVTYRIFPGKDNCTDFTLGRNTHMSISLYLSGPGLRQISWKVESNVSIDQNSATADVVGEHSKDDLYIGERFDCNVDISQDLLTYFEGDLSGVKVKYVSTSNGGSVDFGPLQRNGSDLRYTSRACCTSEGNGDLYLVDKDGKTLMNICTGLQIYEPNTAISYSATVPDNMRSDEFALDEAPILTINGATNHYYIYFTDGWGYNLNSTTSDYNLDLFDFRTSISNDLDAVGKTVRNIIVKGTSSSGGPVLSYSCSCTNDGTDGVINRALCEASAREYNSFDVDILERNHQIMHTVRYGLEIQPFTVTLVDNGWARYDQTQNSVKVKNPSNVEMKIELWQAMSTKHINQPAPDQGDINDGLRRINRDMFEYIVRYDFTNTYPAAVREKFPLILMKSAEITSNPASGYGSPKTVIGGEYVHPVPGLSVDRMSDAARIGTDRYGNAIGHEKLWNFMKVTTANPRLHPSRLNTVDMLSDGSMQWDIIYGKDDGGYYDQGIWSWLGQNRVGVPNQTFQEYRLGWDDFANLSLNPDMLVSLHYDNSTKKVYTASSNVTPVMMDFELVITCKGICTVWPNGIKKEVHYPEKTVRRSIRNVAVCDTRAYMDDSAFTEAMNQIYNTTYTTKDGTFGKKRQKHSTPTDISFTMRVRLSDGAQTSQRVKFDLEYIKTIDYWHAWDGEYVPVKVKGETCNWLMQYITPKQ